VLVSDKGCTGFQIPDLAGFVNSNLTGTRFENRVTGNIKQSQKSEPE